jgi:hypothetical protein
MGNGLELNSFSNGYVGRLFIGDQIMEYANNTTAIQAGLRPGSIYRTGEVLKIVI